MNMTDHIDEVAAWELALGGERPAELRAHLESCPTCRTRIDRVTELGPLLAADRAVPWRSPSLRAQVVGEAAHLSGPTGLRLRAPSVAELMGLPLADAEAALARLADPTAWRPLFPGFSVCSLGQIGASEAGFGRSEAGAVFPRHIHDGDEEILVLQGSCDDSRVGWLGPGDRVLHRAGTQHSFVVPPTVPLLFAFTSRGLTFTE